jgi:hypothetical protein
MNNEILRVISSQEQRQSKGRAKSKKWISFLYAKGRIKDYLITKYK